MESISSSRTSTASCCNNGDGYYGYGITGAASEGSGWTSYLDDYFLLRASPSREEASPAAAREKLHHGVCATASTPSSGANRKEAVKVKGAGHEKKSPSGLELEDPLQDTASSPATANATHLQPWSAGDGVNNGIGRFSSRRQPSISCSLIHACLSAGAS